MSTAPAVEAIDLVKHFGETRAVDGVSFVVPDGTVLGLLGPNGAGKTTLVRMLTTLSVPTSGTGRVAGLRHPAGAERGPPQHGPHRPGGDGRRDPHRAGEPQADRRAVRAAQELRPRRDRAALRPASTSPTPPTGWRRPTPVACAAGSTWR